MPLQKKRTLEKQRSPEGERALHTGSENCTRTKPRLTTCRKISKEVICCLLLCIRPLLGPARCRYPLGCTSFTLQQLRSQSILTALWKSLRRLYSCSSWQPLKEDLFE